MLVHKLLQHAVKPRSGISLVLATRSSTQLDLRHRSSIGIQTFSHATTTIVSIEPIAASGSAWPVRFTRFAHDVVWRTQLRTIRNNTSVRDACVQTWNCIAVQTVSVND